MARVVGDGQVGVATMQFDGNLPHGKVAVNLFVVAGETAVDGTQTLYACVVDALQRTYPQFQVRVHGILDQHRHIDTLESIGQKS